MASSSKRNRGFWEFFSCVQVAAFKLACPMLCSGGLQSVYRRRGSFRLPSGLLPVWIKNPVELASVTSRK
jgi:hypothetical protein